MSKSRDDHGDPFKTKALMGALADTLDTARISGCPTTMARALDEVFRQLTHFALQGGSGLPASPQNGANRPEALSPFVSCDR
jgi:hypothetical protein